MGSSSPKKVNVVKRKLGGEASANEYVKYRRMEMALSDNMGSAAAAEQPRQEL